MVQVMKCGDLTTLETLIARMKATVVGWRLSEPLLCFCVCGFFNTWNLGVFCLKKEGISTKKTSN